jgi:hypothetical protein
MAAQPTLRDGSSGWGRQPASSAPCWAGRQPPAPGNRHGRPRRRRPRHRRQPTLGPRSPRHRPRPDPRARRPGCHRPVHPRRPPRGPGQAGLGRRRRRRHRGPHPGPSTAWPPSSSPRPGQPRHRRNKRPRCGWSWPRRPSTSPWRPVQHLFAGVTFILYGLAVAWSQLYPRWLGLGSGPGRSRLGSGRPNPGIGGRGHHGDQDPDHHHPHHHHPMVDPDGQMGILAFRRAPSTEGAIAGSLKAAAQAHRSGPARRCRRSKKAAWAAVQPTMSTAGTASGHLGMPRTRLDHKLRCHAAERVLHGLLVDGREEVRARPAGRARSPCRRRCPHRVTLVIAG